jgi:hypothetical protein
MPKLFGAHIDIHELKDHTGDLSQVAGIRPFTLVSGKENGVRIAEVRTGSGLRYLITLDRGMDISLAEYKGMPLAWRSGHGDVHPSYYNPDGPGWIDSFPGGLLTGCGMTSVGSPSVDDGEQLGLHGRLSHIPAVQTTLRTIQESDATVFEVAGEIREHSLFKYDMVLRRCMRSVLGESIIHISDSVLNQGQTPVPLMMLYHINIGWPLLSTDSELLLNVKNTTARDEAARKGLSAFRTFSKPQPHYEEQVFYHELIPENDAYVHVILVNRRVELALHIQYRKQELPWLVQWKMLRKSFYVLGIEPANCRVEGRAKERERGTLRFVQPGESTEFDLTMRIYEGNSLIDSHIKSHSLS